MKRAVLLALGTLLWCLLLFSATQVTAQDFCKGNFDYDKDVDGTDASVFKDNFGRSAFSNPCPLDGPAPLQKTGQTESFQFRDDGDLEKGVAFPNERFTDNENGTVTDNLTGLMWTKSAALFGQKYNWEEAFDQVSLLNGASLYDDWRVPNVRELMSLVDFGRGRTAGSCTQGELEPPLPEGHPFVDVKIAACLPTYSIHWYWTSTNPAWGSAYKNFILTFMPDFKLIDLVTRTVVTEEHYVWPVRGGRSPLYQ